MKERKQDIIFKREKRKFYICIKNNNNDNSNSYICIYIYIFGYISVSLYLLYLLSNDNWICFSYLILAQLLVVKFTVVFV